MQLGDVSANSHANGEQKSVETVNDKFPIASIIAFF